jgi:CO/xanthine dehydrogenase FAD-binding subunit
MWQEYFFPQTVDEAVAMLAERAGQARVIAGGTDLVLQLQRGELSARCLVDVSRIEGLRGISAADGFVRVGAAVTHAELAASPLAPTMLAQAAAEVGSPEVRHVATVGGNVVNAQPAADTALALLALDAQVEVTGAAGSRWLALADLYANPVRGAGAGHSAVDPTAEVVCGFRFRAPGGVSGSAYRRLGKCKSIALPVLCAAVLVELDGDTFSRAAISIGPVAPRPIRAGAAERALVGQPATGETLRRAAGLAQAEAKPRDSLLRCARDYREAMVAVLVTSTLEQAVAAAYPVPGAWAGEGRS